MNAIAGFTVDETTLAEYVATDPRIDAVVVLHRGAVVFEAYPRMRASERHLAWSVTKVVVAEAILELERQGRLSFKAPVERYLPLLNESVWAGTSVLDVLNMASGVACLDSDGYQNTEGCVYRVEESLGIVARKNEVVDPEDVFRQMTRLRPAGERAEYASANTQVLGWIVEAVTDQPLWRALEPLIWLPTGAEADALLAVSEAGHAYAAGGLSMRLRDVARFGQLVLERGAYLAEPAIGLSTEQRASFEEDFPTDSPVLAGSQWDLIWADGDRCKEGYSGQGLFVSPKRQLVVAFFGTDDTSFAGHRLTSVARQLSLSLAESGLHLER